MHNFVKHEYLDGDEGVQVFEVTEDFITVNSNYTLTASWLQWMFLHDWEFVNTWRSPEGPVYAPYMRTYTNFKRRVL